VTISVTKHHDLPEPLPAGEEILWQGRPAWRSLAVRAFHARKIAIYFGILAIWRATSNVADGDTAALAAVPLLWLLLLGGAAAGLLTLMAWLTSRMTLYTVTTRRVVMQFGVALPMTLNIPFRVVGSAALKLYANGTGDIPIAITGNDRMAYLVLWPHARPWRARRAEPMLRAVPDAEDVAEILSRALIAATPVAPFTMPDGVIQSSPVAPQVSTQPATAAA
jgi:hypothetical protein